VDSTTVGVVVALALAALLVLFLWLRDTFPIWLPIYGYYPGSKWCSRVDSNPFLIAKALQAAESSLIARTPWTAANLALVGHYVRVHVKDSERWGVLWGRRGQEYTLVVGPSLAGLCHEMAHLCEQVLDNSSDTTHGSWKVNGVEQALEDYDEWLTKQGLGDRGTSGFVFLSRPMVLRMMAACRYKEL
jgi:hypothetical protein